MNHNALDCTTISMDPWSGIGRVNDWRREAAPIVCPGPMPVEDQKRRVIRKNDGQNRVFLEVLNFSVDA